MNVFVTGGTGLLGQFFTLALGQDYTICAPPRRVVDILDKESIIGYFRKKTPDVIIHCAAMVNAGGAENERGDQNGICWKTNVLGTEMIVQAGKEVGALVIYISTGSVFHGSKQTQGPFEITDQPETDPDRNGWYGFTKYQGELCGPDAIIRISHPVIPDRYRSTDDYIHKMLRLYEDHRLHPLFPDQLFPLTGYSDLLRAINRIITEKRKGIFHVASPDLVSPYELFIEILTQLGKPVDERVTTIAIEAFFENGNSPLRFAQYCALSSKKTQELLSLQFLSWKEIVAEAFEIAAYGNESIE